MTEKYSKNYVIALFERAGKRNKNIFYRTHRYKTFIKNKDFSRDQIIEKYNQGTIAEYIDCYNYQSVACDLALEKLFKNDW